MSSVVSNQKFVELPDNTFNVINHLLERIKNKLAFGNLRLPERYIEADLELFVRLSLIGGSGKVSEFAAHYRRHEPIFVEPDIYTHGHINSPFVPSRCDCNQQAMFVHNVEMMDKPECLIESDIWLYRLDDVSRICRDLLYFSVAHGRLVLLGSFGDWEVNTFVGSPARGLHKLPHKVIKHAPDVVNRIANNQRDSVGDRLNIGDIKRCVMDGSYRVRLGSKSVRLVRHVLIDSHVQVSDVLFGSFNFKSDPVSSILRSHAFVTQLDLALLGGIVFEAD
jgi:hypothetical protein